MRNRSAGGPEASRLVWVAGAMMIAVLVTAVSYIIDGDDDGQAQSSQRALVVAAEREAIAELDTDRDGIPDWEENLWGTDPNSADSDGDGKNDSRESLAMAVEGSVAASSSNVERKPFVDEDETNATRALAREYFGSLMSATQVGDRSISEVHQGFIADRALDKAKDVAEVERYRVPPEHIVTSTAVTNYEYISAMSLVTEDLYVNAPGNNTEYFFDWLQHDDEDARENMYSFIAHANPIIDRMTTLTVPEDLVMVHERLVNAYVNYLHDYEAVANIKEDPIQGIIGVQRYLARGTAIAHAQQQFYAMQREFDPTQSIDA